MLFSFNFIVLKFYTRCFSRRIASSYRSCPMRRARTLAASSSLHLTRTMAALSLTGVGGFLGEVRRAANTTKAPSRFTSTRMFRTIGATPPRAKARRECELHAPSPSCFSLTLCQPTSPSSSHAGCQGLPYTPYCDPLTPHL
jgi:hypothetical protein